MSRAQLENMFTLSIDDSSQVSIGLEHLAGSSAPMSGAEIAFELTNVINERFGDGKKFDFSSAADQTLRIYRGSDNTTTIELNIPQILATYTTLTSATDADWDGQVAAEPLAFAINAALADNADFSDVEVAYSASNQGFRFVQTGSSTGALYLNGGDTANAVFGVPAESDYNAEDLTTLGKLLAPLDNDEADVLLAGVLPNGENIIASRDQRFGMKVSYAEGAFTVSSGTTGDTSSLALANATEMAQSLFGISEAWQYS